MNITIHRGTNQIGGGITEIESNGYKVFIDFGEQLPGMEKLELKPIDGLTFGDVSKSALFISHYHGDHIGMIGTANSELPIYVGKTALEIFKCLETRLSYIPDTEEANKHKQIIERSKNINTFEMLQKVKIGQITVTPLFVDHSAFDAYMFIVETDNRRILHTGDFRGHGFKSKGLIPTLKKYAVNIDYIISEGTNIQRPDATIQTESELQKEFETEFKKYKYNFVFVSSTNIDRIVGLYHAAKNAKRCFICDSYQTDILKIVAENHKRFSSFYNINFEQKKYAAGRFFSINRKRGKPFEFNGKLKPYLEKHGFCMLIRSNESYKSVMDEYAKSNETQVYYSMWNGYLDPNKSAFNKSLSNFLKPYKLNYKHTSGHADLKTLAEVFEVVNPNIGVIPIHTEAPERFKELFKEIVNVIYLEDGEILTC